MGMKRKVTADNSLNSLNIPKKHVTSLITVKSDKFSSGKNEEGFYIEDEGDTNQQSLTNFVFSSTPNLVRDDILLKPEIVTVEHNINPCLISDFRTGVVVSSGDGHYCKLNRFHKERPLE